MDVKKLLEEVKSFVTGEVKTQFEAHKKDETKTEVEFSVDESMVEASIAKALEETVNPLNSRIEELEGKLKAKEEEVVTIEASKQELEVKLSNMPKAEKTAISPEGNADAVLEASKNEIPEDLQTPTDRLKSQFADLKFI